MVLENPGTIQQSTFMHLRRRVWVGILLLVSFAGCQKPNAAPPAAKPATTRQPTNALPHLNHAQPKLRTIKLWLGAEEMVTEVALSIEQISTGMMFRKEMAENEAMLFVFARPHKTSFYMKNTTVPLSCAYIDSEGAIVELHDLQPLNEAPVEAKSDNIQYVLEVPQGWFKRHNIGPGTVVRTERGSLPELFFQRKPGQQ